MSKYSQHRLKLPLYVCLICTSISLLFPQDITLTFDCPDEVVAGSEENILPINMLNEDNVGGFMVDIIFPSSEIEIISVNPGDIPCCTGNNESEDTLTVVWFNLLRDEVILPMDGILFEIEYDIIGSTEDISFSFSNIIFSTDDGQPMDYVFSNTCTISVVEPAEEELEVYLGFGEVDPIAKTAEIIMNVNNPPDDNGVTGFQFVLNGGFINEALWGNDWGYLGDYFAMISTSDSLVISFGDFRIQDREGVAFTLVFDEFINNELCISEVLMSNSIGLVVENVTVGDCVSVPQDCTVPGDVNNDGVLDVLDIVSSVCILMDPFECGGECYPDMNNDDIVNVLDIVIMVNIILGNE